ncbi:MULTISPECIES: hypothetical protein [unclassified Arthrobacter]|uniref:hypothetical protein n=1 Tax=unclassified Arthrobacter TaxID=235627 RepID=UPI001E5FC665|nr:MULTISPECIES: hypothetical protein [unclassified Arthrobacter]MCC9145920.1 hypothetical protein [Arthrobacter sp. zg-Y919]MDK1277149.1 hypothetical protein [Arthrobacter sp. zg.Y919]WIB03667.1 hypothetical protein QNO10_03015 [Arthrobacter sp. zg-Y919]
MLTTEPAPSSAAPANSFLAKAMTMMVFPLRRLRPINDLNFAGNDGEQALLDLEPDLFRSDELDMSFMENVCGVGAGRLERVKGPCGIVSGQGTNAITATLDCFVLRGKSHLEAGRSGKDPEVTDLFLAFVSFNCDTEAVGEIAAFLHRPSKCAGRAGCISRGHQGLCVSIRAEIAAVIRDLNSGPGAETEGNSVPLEFTLRGDGNFALKLDEHDSAAAANPSPTYLPQRGRAHALVVSRFAHPEVQAMSHTHDGRSFYWWADHRVWVVSKSGKQTGLPNKMLGSAPGVDKSKHSTLFNDVTMPVLLVIQQAFAIAELRTEFSTLSSRRDLDVLAQAGISRALAHDLLVFRSLTWVTTLSFSPDLTDYLNDIQAALKLGPSYNALMDDFSHWNSHLELLAQVQQSTKAEKNAAFLTILSICIAVGALCFQQGTIPAVACSVVAIIGALAFLFRKRREAKSKGSQHS